MRSVHIALSAAILTFLFSADPWSQTADVDVSSCGKMAAILNAMKRGITQDSASRMLDSVLSTMPYQSMFSHYNRSWHPDHLPHPSLRG